LNPGGRVTRKLSINVLETDKTEHILGEKGVNKVQGGHGRLSPGDFRKACQGIVGQIKLYDRDLPNLRWQR